MASIDWTWPIVAAVVGLFMVVAYLIEGRCKHQWENTGERYLHHHKSEFGESHRFRQPVRCAKCGQCSYFEV